MTFHRDQVSVSVQGNVQSSVSSRIHQAFASGLVQRGSGLLLLLAIFTGCSHVGATAVTAPHPPASSSATLLFKSNFGPGVKLDDTPYGFSTSSGGGGGAWQKITGTDSETGFTWPVRALGSIFSGVQLITVDPVTPSTINDHITVEIRQVRGSKGTPVYELFQNVKKKAPMGAVPVGKGAAQAPFIIQRPWTIGDVTDLYVTYWFKHQANLAATLDPTVSSGNWRVQFEFKTGGATNPSTGLPYYGGDYRIATNVMKYSDGSLYWNTKGDNVANGPWPRVDYWSVANHTVPVPIDTWFKYELFWHRSSGSDGRFWSAVNGQVIVDHHGPNMGKENLPITRIMIDNTYSGGHPEVQSQITGLEIWDGFPCGVGVTCF